MTIAQVYLFCQNSRELFTELLHVFNWIPDPCGGRISSVGGHITSPGFPKRYHNYENCSWIVSVPTNSTVIISFKTIDLEPGHDFIHLYDGGRRGSEPFNTLTGTSIPYDMIMDRSFVAVFVSDHRVRRQGFYMYFQTYQGTTILVLYQ